MQAMILETLFDQPTLDERLQWLNPPPEWSMNPRLPALVVQPGARTDFWQETRYGFRADNGHFLHTQVKGGFSMEICVRFNPAHQYDQAGLMVRRGPECWIKASVEHEAEGPAKLGSVVTNHGFSDWSLQDFPCEISQVHLRIRRESDDFLVEFKLHDSASWTLIRVARLHDLGEGPLECGLYACSPKGAGFRAEFSFLRIVRPVL